MQRLLQVLERSGEVRARQQNQTVLVPSLLSVQLIHPTQVQTHQLSPSTTVKNGSCHPIQTFQQGGQVSRGPCCAAMRVVCHCSTWDGMGYTVGTGVATAQKFAQRPTAFPPQHYCYFGQQVYSKKQTPHSHVCTDEFTQTGATYFITIFRFSECSCSSPQKEEAA